MSGLWFGLFVIISRVSILFGHGGEWNYQDPEEWKEIFPEYCDGSKQSPIDIPEPNGLIKIPVPLNMSWIHYDDAPESIIVTNNGHSIQLEHRWHSFQQVPYLEFSGRERFVFAQLHFHWGRNNKEGSEHKINGQSFPLEMHMVHFNREYGSLNEAIKHPDGLLVITTFYRVSKSTESSGLKNILHAAKSFEKLKTTSEIETFPLSELEVVKSKTDWVTYSGSLTTPKCNEVVTWLISLKIHHVSKGQMESIRSLRLDHGDSYNNRPVQPLNNRKVYLFSSDESLSLF